MKQLISTLGFKSNGWSSKLGPMGAPRSYGVDSLRAELLAKGYTKLVTDDKGISVLPEYHMIRWWKRQTPMGTTVHNQDHTAYAYPPEVADGTLSVVAAQQLLLNLWYLNSKLGFMATANQFPYVGDAGQRNGFAPVNSAGIVDFSPLPPPGYNPEADHRAILPSKGVNAHAFVNIKFDDTLPKELQWRNLTGEQSIQLPDHYTYLLYTNGATDEDVTRYWRSWAIANGAQIDLEPPHASKLVVPEWAVDQQDWTWDDQR